MMNFRYTTVTGLLILLAACGGGSPASNSTKSPINIAAYVPLTGSLAPNGTPMADAYQYGVDEINSAGGIRGHKLNLQVHDDQGVLADASTVATAIGQDSSVVAALGSYGTPISLATSAIFEKAMLPNVHNETGSASMTQRGFKYVFSTYPPVPSQLSTFADFINSGAIKPTRVALLYVDVAVASGGATQLHDYFQSHGVQVVDEEKIQDSQPSYATAITKLKAANPDFLWIYPISDATLKVVLSNMNDQHLQPKWVVTQGYFSGDPALVQSISSLLKGLLGLTYWWPEAPFSSNAAFVKGYTKRFGQAPPFTAATAYQAVQILGAALKGISDENYTRDAIRDALLRVNISDTIAGPVKFDSTGGAQGVGAFVVQAAPDGSPVALYPDNVKKQGATVGTYGGS
jgi:branched-chain amino acid transport system substrate-binding protein